MGSFALVANPRAGAGRAGRLLPAIEAALRTAGADFVSLRTQAPGHATELTRQALRDGAEGVAVVGGDGTLSEALNGFFLASGSPIAKGRWLGPLPAGTGGDFRRTLGVLSERPEDLVRRLLFSEPRPIDCGWVRYGDAHGGTGERAFLNIASFGLAGVVDQLIAAGPKWLGGRAAYFLASLQAKASYGRNRRVKVTVDGEAREHALLNLAVANGRYFGGGMQIAPRARLDDGLFDVVAIERGGWLGPLALTPALYGGGVLGRAGVHARRGRSIHAEALPGEGPVVLDIDGEALGQLPARFDVREGVLHLR